MDKPIINEMPATDLKKSDFFYDLPQELIAQHPAEKRDGSRLMVIDRATGEIAHRHFFDIAEYIRPEDTLVINDSKVIPARLCGHSEGREEASVELLLLRSRGIDEWETLVKPGKRARVGAKIVFGGELVATVTDIVEEGNRPTSPRSRRTRADIRRSMRARKALRRHRPRGFTSRKSFSQK